MSQRPDTLYGHFITPAGLAICKIGRELHIPTFIAYGESSPWSINNIGRKKVIELTSNVTGIISVSSANKDELVSIGIAREEKLKFSPTATILKDFGQETRYFPEICSVFLKINS
jgi:teichuronic acid biosynthesis glycosyltransferase TuaC